MRCVTLFLSVVVVATGQGVQRNQRGGEVIGSAASATARGGSALPVPAAAPSLYWASTPTLANETLLISGAGLEGARVSLCDSSKNCSELGPGAVSVWDHSIKLVLPSWCGPPCSVRVTTTATAATTAPLTMVVNRPDIWWGASDWPLGPDSALAPSVTPVITSGGTLRVFGRGLAWVDGRCVSSATQPGPVQTTTLTLTDEAGVASDAVTSTAASCYEGAFVLPVGKTGRLQAVVTTEWGDSLPFPVIVPPPAPAPAPVPPTVIDVIKDCGGSLALAMRRAAAAPAGAVVELGVRAYSLTEPLVVPNRTAVRGQSPDESSISFVLMPPTLRTDPLRAAVSVGSMVELSGFSISLSVNVPAPSLHNKTQFAGTVALLMPHDASEFVADGLRVTTDGNASTFSEQCNAIQILQFPLLVHL